MNEELGNNGEPVSTMSDSEAEAAAERWARVCRQHLRETYPGDIETVEEYISEAEHQDGGAYWLVNFFRVYELDADFTLYVDKRGPVEGDMDEDGKYRIFSSFKAAVPFINVSNSTFELEVAIHRPERMQLFVLLRDEKMTNFRIGGDTIHYFKLNTWKEVLRVAGQLWRISRQVNR